MNLSSVKIPGLLLITLLLSACSTATSQQIHITHLGENSPDCVMLLHGLARTSAAMRPLGKYLSANGYAVVNIDYPSRHFTVRELSDRAVGQGIEACLTRGSQRIFAVTHSMGGILIRDYLAQHEVPSLQRVVMLAPPNQGSQVVDKLKNLPGFFWLNGPAGMQLGTDRQSVPMTLGPISVDTAVIAGTRTINFFLSTLLPNPDDGKVPVESTRLQGMCAHLSIPLTHTFIMRSQVVFNEVKSYLSNGMFLHEDAEYPDCEHRTGSLDRTSAV